MDDFRTRLAKFWSDAKAAEGSVKRILRTAFTSCIWVIGADRIPALSGASYTNQPEEDDDPDRPSLFKFGQRYKVTGRPWILEPSATGLCEPDLHVFAKLFEDRLERGLEAQALSGREIGGDDDVLNFFVGHLVDVDLTRQPAA